MDYLCKPYYICLITAAEFFGAAHQRSQRFSIMTVYPQVNVSIAKNNQIDWVHRKVFLSGLIEKYKNSKTIE